MTKNMLASMAKNPIVFAMANPDPEISFEDAMSTRDDLIFATGRSDYPNQINNVLGFPFIFRGALDVRASIINEEMKLAASKALAELAKEPVPECVLKAYNIRNTVIWKELYPTQTCGSEAYITCGTGSCKGSYGEWCCQISHY